MAFDKATCPGGLYALGVPLRVLDSITEALPGDFGAVLVSGSHGGLSSARYALRARPRLAVFNDAGIGKDDAGIAALEFLQPHGIAACTVAHDSARIGQAASTLEDGVVSRCNEAAGLLGCTPGLRLHDWLLSGCAEGSSPAHR